MNLTIAQLGQPVLRRPAAEVLPDAIAAPAFQRLLDDMLETLQTAKAAGLAGPQVFESRRVFLAAVLPPPEEEAPRGVELFINPRLTALAREQALSWEGCLSFPELLVLVPRFTRVRVEYLGRDGQPRALDLDGFPARVVQHENDHLDGILTLDRAPSTRCIIKGSELETVLEAMEKGTYPT
jgi:peptide deformylase